jgi:hypothetical protein
MKFPGFELNKCLASITFSGQRQLFFPIGDNYLLYSLAPASYSGADRSRG